MYFEETEIQVFALSLYDEKTSDSVVSVWLRVFMSVITQYKLYSKKQVISYNYKLIMMETLHEVVVVCWIDDNRGEELEEA